MPLPPGLDAPLRIDPLELGLQRQVERERRRLGRLVDLDRLVVQDQVEIPAGMRLLAGALHHRGGSHGQRNAGGHRERLLGAGKDEVEPPRIGLDR